LKHKILFISAWFPNKLEATNGNFVQRHAEASALSNDVEILHAIGDFNQKENFLFDDKIINGIRTLIVYYKNTHNPLLNFARRMSAYKKGFGKLFVPDLVHANVLHNSMMFAVYLKNKFKIPFVLSEHWNAFRKINENNTSSKIKYFAKKIGNQAEFIFPVSEDLKLGLQNLGIKTSMKTIPNAVDINVFTPKIVANQTFTFLHISNLIPLKNASKILVIALKLLENGFDFKLKIGGDGLLTEIDNLKKLVFSSQFSDKIEVFGIQTLPQVADKMRSADCFILYSADENQPCVIAEAFASGIPIISTNVGGISEYFPANFGILIEKPDIILLENAMVAILNKQKNFANSNEISIYANKYFSKEEIGKNFTEIYSKILRE
jgi:glycosyltransferase involved in cell wall biosynthesis